MLRFFRQIRQGLLTDNDLRRELSTYYKYQNLLTGLQDRQKDLTRIFVDYVSTRLMTRENIQMFYRKPNDFPSAA